MDVDAVLAQEATETARSKEIDRIFATVRLDWYAVLDLRPDCSDADIKRQFRTKSLMVHPDKTQNQLAPAAFALLSDCHKSLLDDKSRAKLDNIYASARSLLLKERNWEPSDVRLGTDVFLADWRDRAKDLLVEQELRRRKLQKVRQNEESREIRHKEEVREQQHLHKLREKMWEDSADRRVDSWRRHVNRKKKRKDSNVLG